MSLPTGSFGRVDHIERSVMMEKTTGGREIVVIGGGPGGYVAAIRAAQLGARVTLIERGALGGTCLNAGCIPTKALLHCADLVRQAREGERCGIHMSIERIDWHEVLTYQSRVVQAMTSGVQGLLRKNQVKVVQGSAAFLKPGTLQIEKADGVREILEADRVILAVGSAPFIPPIAGLKESRYLLDSSGALSMPELPDSMVVIGGGVVGVELACALNALGCRVTIVEAMPSLLPSMDRELADRLAVCLERQGIRLLLGCQVRQVRDGTGKVLVSAGGEKGERILEADRVLCAVGRRPDTAMLCPEAGGIRCQRGRIVVDDRMQTNIPGVYAVGDCTSAVMLAHVASAQGEIAAENACGGQSIYRPACIPSGVYGFPELAGVGLTEEQAKEQNIPFHVGRFPLSANGRAVIAGEPDGMAKVIIGDELGEILGVHILGPHATEIIGEGSSAICLESTAEEMIAAVHAHPTISEAIREAVLEGEGRPVHTLRRPKKGELS